MRGHAAIGQSTISLLALWLVLPTACSQNTSSIKQGGDTAALPRVVFHLRDGQEQSVPVELVDQPADRARGLMYREYLDPRSGMLFVFDEDAVQTFWMKNTYIPLDMIFINSGGLVVGVVENAPPETTDPRSVGIPSRYVLEVNAGFARQHGIVSGVKATVHQTNQ